MKDRFEALLSFCAESFHLDPCALINLLYELLNSTGHSYCENPWKFIVNFCKRHAASAVCWLTAETNFQALAQVTIILM